MNQVHGYFKPNYVKRIYYILTWCYYKSKNMATLQLTCLCISRIGKWFWTSFYNPHLGKVKLYVKLHYFCLFVNTIFFENYMTMSKKITNFMQHTHWSLKVHKKNQVNWNFFVPSIISLYLKMHNLHEEGKCIHPPLVIKKVHWGI